MSHFLPVDPESIARTQKDEGRGNGGGNGEEQGVQSMNEILLIH
jgi:hypothetical protein